MGLMRWRLQLLLPSASAALCGLLLPSAVASAFCFCRPLLLLPSASAALCWWGCGLPWAPPGVGGMRCVVGGVGASLRRRARRAASHRGGGGARPPGAPGGPHGHRGGGWPAFARAWETHISLHECIRTYMVCKQYIYIYIYICKMDLYV